MSALQPPRLVNVTRPLGREELAELSLGATLTLWNSDALRTFDSDRALDFWIRRPNMAIAFIDREVEGRALAAALRCDWLAMTSQGILNLTPTPDVLTAVAARASKRILPLLLGAAAPRESGEVSMTAAEAMDAGIADALVGAGEDSLKWLRNWLNSRSLRALDSAATLLRTNRSEAGERIEFARLFSTGEPQRGLSHFLEKTPAPFGSEITVETI